MGLILSPRDDRGEPNMRAPCICSLARGGRLPGYQTTGTAVPKTLRWVIGIGIAHRVLTARRERGKLSLTEAAMKRLVLALVVVLALVGCAPAVDPGQDYYIYDSTWTEVSADELALKLASKSIGAKALAPRAISQDAAAEAVAEYNASTTDDQLYLMDEETPIEEAPLADVYIGKDGVILASFLQIARADFRDRRAAYELEAQMYGGTLYVDQIPPAPPVDTRTDYEKYALYLYYKADGSIYYQTHCEDWEAEGFASIQARYAERYNACQLEVQMQGESVLGMVYGQIYTPPA